MSTKGSVESLSSKSKKDKEKQSKKEKKEKGKKRDSKYLENNVEAHDETTKTKKKFGLFRIGGKKSKDPQHDSSDSLHVRDSGEFGSTASDLSLVESSASTESATIQPSQQTALNSVRENTNVKLQSNATESKRPLEKEIKPKLADIVYTGPKKIRTVPGKVDGDDSSPKEHSINKKLQATEQPETDPQQQNTSKKPQDRSFEVQMQSSAISVKPNEGRESRNRNIDLAQKSITSTYKEGKGLPQDHSPDEKMQNETPLSEASFTPKHHIKQQVHDQSDRHFDPSLSGSTDETSYVVSSESLLTYQEVLEKNTTVVEEIKVDVKQSVISSENQTRGPPQNNPEYDQVQKEAAVKEEAVPLVYPDKHQVSYQHGQQDDIVEDEIPIVEAASNNVESQLEVDEFLYTNIKETWGDDEGSHKKVDKKEREMKMSEAAKESKSRQEGLDEIYDHRQQSSYFDKETDFISTSSKPSSLSNKTDTQNEKLRSPEITGSENFESSENLSFINTIKEVKMSSTMLLAELAEVNKKLQELKNQLLEVLKKGRNEP